MIIKSGHYRWFFLMEAFCFWNKQQALTKDIWIAIIFNSDHNLFATLLKLIIILQKYKNIRRLIKAILSDKAHSFLLLYLSHKGKLLYYMGSNAFMTRHLKNKSDAHFEIPFLTSHKPCSHQNRLKRKKNYHVLLVLLSALFLNKRT